MSFQSKQEFVAALRSLVEYVYDYSNLDPDWALVSTKEAQESRDKMRLLAKQIMFSIGEWTLTDDEMDRIFDWD